MRHGDPRRGVILVTVLWSIALLSALAMAAAVSFRGFAGVMAVERDRVQGDALLSAGLETAAGIIEASGETPLAEIERTINLATGSTRLRLNDEGGRIDIGFLGAAQIDRFANINTTVIGDYNKPSTRLPGAGGAPEIATSSREVLITLRQNKRAFVEKLDFVTSAGHLDGGDARKRLGSPGKGPTCVITDLGILTPDPVTKELTLTSLHPGMTVERALDATGWPLKVAATIETTPAPTATELSVLRELQQRTARAHAGQA